MKAQCYEAWNTAPDRAVRASELLSELVTQTTPYNANIQTDIKSVAR